MSIQSILFGGTLDPILIGGLVAYIVYRRLSRGINGQRFSFIMAVRLPTTYTLLTALASLYLSLADILIEVAADIIGLIVGIRFRNTAEFYTIGVKSTTSDLRS